LIDPDALAAELSSRHVEFSEPLKDTADGLHGFKLKDYVLFFGGSLFMSAEIWRNVASQPIVRKSYSVS